MEDIKDLYTRVRDKVLFKNICEITNFYELYLIPNSRNLWVKRHLPIRGGEGI